MKTLENVYAAEICGGTRREERLLPLEVKKLFVS